LNTIPKIVYWILLLVLNTVINVTFATETMCQQEGLDQCSAHSRPLAACQDVIFGAIPDANPNEIKICHASYLSASNTVTKTPDWIAYHLTAQHLAPQQNTRRTEYFCPDPCLMPGQRAELSDYAGLFPNFNRGHMSPASDNKWNSVAYKECYFLSNILPQNPENNGGIWQKLESYTDSWAKVNNDLYIIDGPVYDYNGVQHQVVGAGKLWAPAALFKIIYMPSRKQVLSFIIPNQNISPSELSNYLTSINTINRLTGLNLFSDLPSDLKAQVPSSLWPLPRT
jgi:endonuclease G